MWKRIAKIGATNEGRKKRVPQNKSIYKANAKQTRLQSSKNAIGKHQQKRYFMALSTINLVN